MYQQVLVKYIHFLFDLRCVWNDLMWAVMFGDCSDGLVRECAKGIPWSMEGYGEAKQSLKEIASIVLVKPMSALYANLGP